MTDTDDPLVILSEWLESKGFTEERARIKARDLIDWFNCSQPDADDIKRLKRLISSGRFKSWSCPACGDRVFEADPEDWGHFQGVHQNDRTSYPGRGPNDRRCDCCRCHNY